MKYNQIIKNINCFYITENCATITCIQGKDCFTCLKKKQYERASRNINHDTTEIKLTAHTVDDNFEYQIEKIIFVNISKYFQPLIKWKGYSNKYNSIYNIKKNDNIKIKQEFYDLYQKEQNNSFVFIRHRDSIFSVPAVLNSEGKFLLYDFEYQTYHISIEGATFEPSTNQHKNKADYYYKTFKEVVDEFKHVQRNTGFFIYKNGGNKASKITQFIEFLCFNEYIEPIIKFRINNKTYSSFICNLTIGLVNMDNMNEKDYFYKSDKYNKLVADAKAQYLSNISLNCVPNALNYFFQGNEQEIYFTSTLLEENKCFKQMSPNNMTNFKYLGYKGKEFFRKTLAK